MVQETTGLKASVHLLPDKMEINSLTATDLAAVTTHLPRQDHPDSVVAVRLR
jgi:hypothetical protein